MKSSTASASNRSWSAHAAAIAIALLRAEQRREIALELRDELRDAFGAPAPMADRIVDGHALRARAVREPHLHGVTDRALVGVEIVAAEFRVLRDDHLGAQRIDARIARDLVLVVLRRQTPEQQRHGHHVLQAMIAIGRVRERPRLVDDAHARLLRLDRDAHDIGDARRDDRVQLQRRLDRRLRVKLRRKRDLEQHVLHDVRAQGALERDRPAFEQHVLKAPPLRGQRRRVAHLAGASEQGMPHAAARRVSGGPALARAGVRRVAVGA